MRHKSIFINFLLKIVLIWPGFVESWFFKKLMLIFPKFLSGRIDFDAIIAKDRNYRLPLEKGIEKYSEIVGQKPVKILDLATGTGAAALYLAQYFSESDVIGVDLAEEMLAVAEEKAKKKELRNLEFKINDIYDLYFSKSEFDLVVVSNAPFSFNEVKRVLKDNKYFLISISHGGKFLKKEKNKIKKMVSVYGYELIAVDSFENSGSYILLKNSK